MIFLDLLAAATEYLCGILIVSAFFPKREGKEKTRITAVILCGLIHILLSMFTNHWNMTRMNFKALPQQQIAHTAK